MNISDNDFKLGKSKIFFKAGILVSLEESRDIAIAKIIVSFQSHIRSYLIKIKFTQFVAKRSAVSVLQRNLKFYLKLKNCAWWNLFGNLNTLLQKKKNEVNIFMFLINLKSVFLMFEFKFIFF